MKSSQAKKASITLPAEMEKQLQKVAKEEHRTLSGVLQEAARQYLATHRWEALQREVSLKARGLGIHNEEDVDKLIHAMRAKS